MKIAFLRILFFMLLLSVKIMAQDNDTSPQIKVLAQVEDNAILLRWSADQPIAWKRSNEYGYTIERFTIKRNGILLETPERVLISQTPIKPLPLEEWEAEIEENDHAAILAQALYGDNFEVEEAQSGALMQIINTSKELNQRFSFALYAADMSFKASQMSGMGYVDNTIKNNETYFYRISSNVPENFGKIDPGTIAVDPSKPHFLPAPIELFVVEGDQNIMLSWEYETYKRIYNSYFVERSDDGVNFKRLKDIPLVNLNDKPDAPAKRMYYVDTLSQNNKLYHYRVIGVSPFGREGKPSEVISGMGKPTLNYNAHISDYTLKEDGSVDLVWDFPKEGEKLIKGFALNQGSTAKGPFEIVVDNISPGNRNLNFDKLKASNYFTITSIGKHDNSKTSLPVFVQPIDSIPPASPIGLSGTIDSTGIARVKWQSNSENDLLGYRVYRGNTKSEELVQLTSSPIETTVFVDTVQVASLNSRVYYSIVAVDQRFNQSDYSKILTLDKPDIVPPTSPVFSNYRVQKDTVRLSWIPSSSDDVSTYELYRKAVTEQNENWKLVHQSAMDTSYIDTGLEAGHSYRYAIFATDKNGLRSDPSTPVTVSITNSEINLKSLKKVQGIADKVAGIVTVSWKDVSNQYAGYLVYKKKNENKPLLFREITAKENSIVDKSVTPNNTYTYFIKPILPNGKYGKPETVKVEY